jgi:hypothetical protein
MDETKEKIEAFVNEAINKNNFGLLDVLWTFYFCLLSTSISARSQYHDTFQKGFQKVCQRNLQKKRSLKKEEIKEKISTFYDFLNSISDPLPDELFGEILVNKSSKILLQEIKDKIQDLSELDKKILSFTLNFRARQQFFRI